MRLRIKESIRKRYNRIPPGMGYHSDVYHHHFEDWSEFEEQKSNGKVRIRRVYTGVWYRQDLSDRRRIFLKLLFSTLFVFAAVLFIICSAQYVGSNQCWYVAITQAGAIAGLVWMGIGIFNHLTAKKRMTIAEYRSSSGTLRVGSIIVAISFTAAMLMTLLFVLLQNKEIMFGREVMCAAGYLICVVAVFTVNHIERKIRYIETPSGNEAPREAVIVD
ncbi:MAG: hypothetical protein Q7U53_03710 [Anaerolineaceae bacterium]|nr:hypothetical protein [Anaerolineaceae bacterium]